MTLLNAHQQALAEIKEARDEAKAHIELVENIEKVLKTKAGRAVIDEWLLTSLPADAAKTVGIPGQAEIAKENSMAILSMSAMLRRSLSTAYAVAESAHNQLDEIDAAEAEYMSQTGEA
jgi:hypothetical protein